MTPGKGETIGARMQHVAAGGHGGIGAGHVRARPDRHLWRSNDDTGRGEHEQRRRRRGGGARVARDLFVPRRLRSDGERAGGGLHRERLVIRGVNSEGQTAGGLGAPLASFYGDGIQQTVEGTRRGIGGVFDAEQIEVYRGPQSTLSGRAALAGAIYLRTNDPAFEREGRVQLTYGEDERRQFGLMYNDTLGPNLAFRISGVWSEKDSDLNYPSYEQYDRYDDFVTDDYWSLRGKLLWLPTGSEATRVLLTYSRSFEGPTSNDIAGPLWSTGAPEYDERRGDIWGSSCRTTTARWG